MAGEIVPPQPVPNQFLQQQQLQQNPASQVQEVQQVVSKLPAGAQLVAQITGADKQGNLTVRIAGSELVLSSPIALAKGAQLTLKLVNASDTVAFQLVGVGGKLPPTQAQQVSNLLQNPTPNSFFKALGYDVAAQKLVQVPFSAAQAAAAQSSSPSSPATVANAAVAAASQAVVINNSANPTLQGVVLSPSPEAIKNVANALNSSLPADKAAQAIAQLPPNLGTGAKVEFQISNVQTPQTQSTAGAASNNPQTPVETGNSVLKGQDFQRQQNEQVLRDSGFVPRVSVNSEGATRLTAQVVGLNGSQALVETSLGRVVIPNQYGADRIAVGSVLTLDVQKISAQELDLAESSIRELLNQWPALKALAQSGGTDTLNKLAGLDGLFASRMAGFFKAVKENNLDNWLSKDLLRKLTPETQEAMKAKLTGDFANITRLYNDNSNSGWHTVLLPVFDGKELQQANFYVKDLSDEEGSESGNRFVVELSTGGFGEVQLDGLVRKNPNSNRFDLMVRTAVPLGEEVRAGITEIFTTAAEVTGIKGGVDFGKLDDKVLRPANAVLAQQMDHGGFEA